MGGTSVLTHELAPLFAAMMPYVGPDAQISLEAKPDDVKTASARLWRDLGVNRLSVSPLCHSS